MATTPTISLRTLTWEEEAKITIFDDWVKYMNDSSISNTVKIDAAFSKVFKESVSYKQTIAGDGVKTSFTVPHNRKNTSPLVSIIDESTGTRMFPNIKIIDMNSIVVTWLYPLELGRQINISVN